MADIVLAEEQTNILRQRELNDAKRTYNTPDLSKGGIPRFNGSAEDCFYWMEQIKLIARTRQWPTGNKGSTNHLNEYGGITANAAVIPWNAPDPRIAAQAAGNRPLTNAEKDIVRQGLFKPQPWVWTHFPVVNVIAPNNAGAIGQPAPNANAFNANIELDGVEIIPGQIITQGNRTTVQQINTSKPALRGRTQTAANNGGNPWITTSQWNPINDCARSRKVVELILQTLSDTARTWYLNLEENQIPRVLENVRWEGQAENALGNYGLYAMIEQAFIHPDFRKFKYDELKQFHYGNYPLPRSLETNRVEPANMQTFVRWYKSALHISKANFGDLVNQQTEFLKRIPQRIVNSIQNWQVYTNNISTDMETLYGKAIEIESRLTHQGHFFERLVPMTEPRRQQHPRVDNRIRTRMINRRQGRRLMREAYNIDIETINNDDYDQYEREPGSGFQDGWYDNQEINNNEMAFAGNAIARPTKSGKTQYKFSGSTMDKRDLKCFNCDKTGHFAAECPQKTQRRPTRAMSRNNSRTRKGMDRIERNHRSRSRDRSGRFTRRYNQGQRDRFRKRIIGNVEYLEDEQGILTPVQQEYDVNNIEQDYNDQYNYKEYDNEEQFEEIDNLDYRTNDNSYDHGIDHMTKNFEDFDIIDNDDYRNNDHEGQDDYEFY
jgi:hypothetical protein